MHEEERDHDDEQRHPLRPVDGPAQPDQAHGGEDDVDDEPREQPDAHLPGLREAAHERGGHGDRHRHRRPAQAEDGRVGRRPHAEDVAQHEGRGGQVGHEEPEGEGVDEEEPHEDVVARQLARAVEEDPHTPVMTSFGG